MFSSTFSHPEKSLTIVRHSLVCIHKNKDGGFQFQFAYFWSVIVGYLNTFSPNEWSSMTIQVKNFQFKETFSRPYFPFKWYFTRPEQFSSSLGFLSVCLSYFLKLLKGFSVEENGITRVFSHKGMNLLAVYTGSPSSSFPTTRHAFISIQCRFIARVTTDSRWEFKRVIRLCMGNKIPSIMKPKKCSIWRSFNKMNKNDSPLGYSFAFWSFSGIPCFQCSETKCTLRFQPLSAERRFATRKSIPAAIFSRKAKAPSLANLRECFVVKNPHALGWKWAFSVSLPR